MDRAAVIAAPFRLVASFSPFVRTCCTVLVVGAALLWSAPSPAHAQSMKFHPKPSGDKAISTPHQARQLGLDSLRWAVLKDKGVPTPSQLDDFVKDRRAAIELGKALFWDMQLGSDGVMTCASCHYHAGADNRTRNQLNPDRLTVVDARDGDIFGYSTAPLIADVQFQTRQPNETLVREDFPLIKSIEEYYRAPNGTVLPGANNSNDIVASMGTLFTFFEGVRPGSPYDAGTLLDDPVWNVDGRNVRRTEPRNAPSVINAVFNFTNFWDGRANPHFNGGDVFGAMDPYATVAVNTPGVGLVDVIVSIDNASLASQTMDPVVSFVEMAYGSPGQGNFRFIQELGVKLLRSSPEGVRLVPLGLQKVDRHDSVLGHLSNAPFRGLHTSYEAMIKRAFHDRYWNSTQMTPFPTQSVTEFTHMEVNFPLFLGLAIQLYEATLVSDRTPFDRWMETGRFNPGFGKQELAGLNLFVNEGKCIECHAGPELTNASVRQMKDGKGPISAMSMAEGKALYDRGFYNIGVTPTTDDLGRGGAAIFGLPLSFSRQALFDRLDLAQLDFPIFGNDRIPAKDETDGTAVCSDVNHNGKCDPDETLQPTFQRAAVDGTFKTPGLRNVELTGPYFHNGGVATLRQVVQFYNRGGNFCRFNERDLDTNIQPLGLSALQERQLVAFMLSLTDPRVRHQAAPFDHPELRIPTNGFLPHATERIDAVGAMGTWRPLRPFLDLDPNDAIFTPVGECTPSN